ncbi:MAG: hypothetical protein E6J90_44015 [Deltaproteobacteria bacterium]|nr:MAG: hypothetical protein E6J91_46780 [Deltaproteobacteria bacterium]TMQ07235.1 MAG: hypothetical protein E6J90_44015 [Deltaproteobacteria bacterium]
MPATVAFRVTYARYGELRDDVAQQMTRGGLLVKVRDAPGLTLDTPVALELVLPDGTTLQSNGKVLQIFAGFGVAVSVEPLFVERAGQYANRPEIAASGAARHEWIERVVAHRSGTTRPPPLTAHAVPLTAAATQPPPIGAPAVARARSASTPSTAATAPAAPRPEPPPQAFATGSRDGLTRNEKIQKALHGTRDERNAILRDRDRTLHPFVLKNPQLDADDVLTIAKNAQVTPDLLKLIGERKDWLQRPAIAIALARNPKTPPELAVRAVEHVPAEALRLMAKGGVLPHVSQAARKKLLG